MKHFGGPEESEEESVHMDEKDGDSEGSRHIDQSLVEEDK